jgi:tetratricopeptide (TPR) repeat protein
VSRTAVLHLELAWFGRKAKLRKAIDRALARVEQEDDLADHAPIEVLPAELQAETYGRVALALFHDERYTAAQVSLARALELAPDESELHELAAAVASHLGAIDEAIAAQRRVVVARPGETRPIEALADLLMGAERIDEVIELLRAKRGLEDPVLETRLAEALFVSGQHAEALDILDQVCAVYDVQLKRAFEREWQDLKARADEASRLRDDVFAELHGREATIELAAADGKLDARAGVNYRLLRRAPGGGRIARRGSPRAPGARRDRAARARAALPRTRQRRGPRPRRDRTAPGQPGRRRAQDLRAGMRGGRPLLLGVPRPRRGARSRQA